VDGFFINKTQEPRSKIQGNKKKEKRKENQESSLTSLND
jgi:hypothetical protein